MGPPVLLYQFHFCGITDGVLMWTMSASAQPLGIADARNSLLSGLETALCAPERRSQHPGVCWVALCRRETGGGPRVSGASGTYGLHL